MIFESILIIGFAITLDLIFGDPRNKYHPTAWIGNFIGNLELNESLKIDNPITLMDILSSTGLEIKADPGIVLIYLGFLFLMISTLISYITYSQIWIVQDRKKIFIGGNTTRATFDFELEFLKLVK